jgi:hypothetical protein
MHALLKLRINRALRDRLEWRQAFFAALDRRLFSDLPPMVTDAEVTGNSKESKPFAEGFQHGMTCPLAVSMPEHDVAANDDDDPYTKAAWLSAALVCAAMITLYIQST